MVLPYLLSVAVGGIVAVALFIFIQEQKSHQFQYSCKASSSPSGRRPPRPPPRQPPRQPRPATNFKCKTCAICLEELNGLSSSTSTLECGHQFHSKCLSELIRHNHNLCPTCRAVVKLRDEPK